MPEREYHIEEVRGAGDPKTRERPAELAEEGWGYPVVQWLQRADGRAFLVLVMSRPLKEPKNG